jgi:hypothetical protein
MNKSALLFFPALIAAATLSASGNDTDVLARAHRMQLEFREGNYEIAKPLVKMLEAAAKDSPDNARLWEALGHANMSLQGSMFSTSPDMAAMLAVGERARDAYTHALSLNGNNMLVRVSHGMSQYVVSQLKGDGPGMAAGIEEMNAAVRDAPKATTVRLTRAFTIIHLPPAMRDTKAVTEDLNFILDAATGGRPEDVMHVLLGDVHAEMGDLESARAQYSQVTGASAFAAEQVKSRLIDLQKGAIPPASIAEVRMGTGTRCAMCHAPGTDN